VLFAVTNGERHLGELWDLIGLDRYRLVFSSENGETLLSEQFDQVERRDVIGTEACHLTDDVPAFSGPFSATRCNTVVTATK
jgi:hypothetical protein